MESTKTSASWRERLDVLNAQLKREPEHLLANRWRLEIRILRFFLKRYGETVLEAPPETRRRAWISPRAWDAQPERRLLPSERIRALRHIAEAGEEARETPPSLLEKYALQCDAMARQLNDRDARQRERERQLAARMRERVTRRW